MMPSELPPGSRTGEGHEMFSQFLQWVTRTIFSRFQGGLGGLESYFLPEYLVVGYFFGGAVPQGCIGTRAPPSKKP